MNGPVASSAVETDHRWLKYIDSLAKLLAAGAIVAAAIIAAKYESRGSSLSLLNQREQSESQLRASMFQDLVEPIVGSKGGEEIAAEREELLVELLTLNFHDHFEFKPLLVRVDGRLASKKLEDNRAELAAVARRVIDRQINMLMVAEEDRFDRKASVKTFVYTPGLARTPQAAEPSAAISCAGGTRTCRVISPDGAWQVDVTIWKLYPDRRTAEVLVSWRPTCGKPSDCLSAESLEPGGIDYELTRFDFPLTDYTQVDNAHRFAISLFDFDKDGCVLKIVWFPRGYITERERPFDYGSLRRTLQLKK